MAITVVISGSAFRKSNSVSASEGINSCVLSHAADNQLCCTASIWPHDQAFLVASKRVFLHSDVTLAAENVQRVAFASSLFEFCL